ncbi:MAG: N-6 DNA methylase [Clostridia bacterium]
MSRAALPLDVEAQRSARATKAAVRKETGSYYTPVEVAEFLATVAVQQASDRVLEPCYGEGVFLEALEAQFRQRFACEGDLVGVDLDPGLLSRVQLAHPGAVLHARDFFDIEPGALGSFNAIVGNPPFVRYHRFNGSRRTLGLRRTAEAGVAVSALTSAWVPFLIHASRHLAPGGRLCMVAPLELLYARYARPLVAYLCQRFRGVRVLRFAEPLFPGLNEGTVLLLADGWGGCTDEVAIMHARRVADVDPHRVMGIAAEHVSLAEWSNGAGQPNLLRLSPEIRALYEDVAGQCVSLGDLARITIGYVTGRNDWFHLTADDVQRGGLDADVRLVLRKSADLAHKGLWLDEAARAHLANQGAHWLFDPGKSPGPAARQRIQAGALMGVSEAYKCRVRPTWWQVPGVVAHDFVLGVFSTGGPRLVVTDLPATNSLLVGDVVDETNARCLAAAAITSLARFSAEVTGHALGGGALKFEPAEARRWLLPYRDSVPDTELTTIHRLLAAGRSDEASRLADVWLLQKGLGLGNDQLRLLREGTQILRALRWRGSLSPSDR